MGICAYASVCHRSAWSRHGAAFTSPYSDRTDMPAGMPTEGGLHVGFSGYLNTVVPHAVAWRSCCQRRPNSPFSHTTRSGTAVNIEE